MLKKVISRKKPQIFLTDIKETSINGEKNDIRRFNIVQMLIIITKYQYISLK